MGVSSGTLAFAYTLPPFRSVTGFSPVSYRPCWSHLKKPTASVSTAIKKYETIKQKKYRNFFIGITKSIAIRALD
jgi:hypothetical protein